MRSALNAHGRPGRMSRTALHTIGYEGSSIDEFLATLRSAGIDLLIDVRDVPISRKKGFSKSALAAHAASNGIEYLHLKGLGDPKPGRIAAREGRFDDFRRIFGAHLNSDIAQADIKRGIEVAKDRRACLLCFERDHTHCHRCMIAEEMARCGGFRLVHLQVLRGSHRRSAKGGQCADHGARTAVG